MSGQRKWGIIYLTAFIIMIFLNYWSTTNVGSVASDNQALIQPAGYAFSIWGFIYLLILIWVIRIFFSKSGGPVTHTLKFWPAANFLLNGLWILTFTAEWIGISTLVIFGILFTLIKMYYDITKLHRHWFDRFPVSIYFGWVTGATIVNVFTFGVSGGYFEWLGLSELSWSLIAVVILTALAVTIGFNYRDWVYPLVIVWVYAGVYVENGNVNALLDIVLILSCVILIPLSFIEGFRKIKLDKSR